MYTIARTNRAPNTHTDADNQTDGHTNNYKIRFVYEKSTTICEKLLENSGMHVIKLWTIVCPINEALIDYEKHYLINIEGPLRTR